MCSEVELAIETYDHVLWAAIIRVCGMALSKSFSRRGNSARVVYQTYDPEFPGIGDPVDPREAISQIATEVTNIIFSCLPIRKLGTESRRFISAKSLCSHHSYLDFLLFGSELMTEADRLGVLYMGYTQIPVFCDFVEMGIRGESGYISCPCTGEHLRNTGYLGNFKRSLQKPKRVGKDIYEFRFGVSE